MVQSRIPLEYFAPEARARVQSLRPQQPSAREKASRDVLGIAAATVLGHNQLVLSLFEFLGITAFCKVARVCRLWSTASKRERLWRVLDLSDVKKRKNWIRDSIKPALERAFAHNLVSLSLPWGVLGLHYAKANLGDLILQKAPKSLAFLSIPNCYDIFLGDQLNVPLIGNLLSKLDLKQLEVKECDSLTSVPASDPTREFWDPLRDLEDPRLILQDGSQLQFCPTCAQPAFVRHCSSSNCERVNVMQLEDFPACAHWRQSLLHGCRNCLGMFCHSCRDVRQCQGDHEQKMCSYCEHCAKRSEDLERCESCRNTDLPPSARTGWYCKLASDQRHTECDECGASMCDHCMDRAIDREIGNTSLFDDEAICKGCDKLLCCSCASSHDYALCAQMWNRTS